MDENKSNQWELDGDCSLCRRKNYCSKDCSRRKQFKKSYVKSMFREVMHEHGLDQLDGYAGKVFDYM